MTTELPSELRAQLRLAIPLAAQQLGFQLMNTVDALLLGRYDDTALAAAGVGGNLLFVVTAIGLGIVMGMDTVVPQALGAGRTADARRLLGAGLRIAILVGLAATLVVLATPLVLDVAGVDRGVAFDARVYVDLRAVGIVPFLISVALRSYLAAHSVTRPLVIAVVIGNVANFGLDLLLIFGVDAIGLPPLGVIGAATATSVVQIATLAIYWRAVRTVDTSLDLPTPRPPSTTADLRAIARYGLPVGGQLFAEVGVFGVATVLAARLGEVPAAAHAIALNLSSFTFSVAVGVGSATSVRVGHAVGAGDLALARRRGLIGLAVGAAAMMMFGGVFVGLATPIARGFTHDATTVSATVALLQIAAVFQLSDGIQAVGAGALRGLGDTGATLWANLVGHYLIGFPISLGLGFALAMGVVGLWWGLSAGLTATAVFLVGRFLFKTRIRSPR
ncbi:MAG: MATE family efflux transporter [Proteobacteria bacterium]|nr:MATE family efflux transporter [Pseudomonadota bacterium]